MWAADTTRDGGIVPRSAVVMALVLTLAMTFSYCDRFVLNLVIEPIKRDLGLLLMWLSMFFNTVLLTGAAPAVQELLPNRMQGTIIALYALVVTVVGLGLGPTAVALITDYILHDEHRVGVALACVSFVSTTAAVLTGWVAAQSYGASLAEREQSA